ncbi:hypothetical protein MTO96_038790 [Rhipicephalus appendiculatus]
MKFKEYVTQGGTAFPRPGVVLALLRESQWSTEFVSNVAWFQKYHSYIQWLFPVRDHGEVLHAFNDHVCQVFTVTDTEINMPWDGYRKCVARRVLTTAQDNQLIDPVPPAGTYSKNELIRYAVDDASNEACFRFRGITLLFREVYRILNNTFEEVCNHGDTDSLLLDRQVDFILGESDRINPGSYYGYVTLPLDSLCFMTGRKGPVAPSFASNWLFFFAIFLIVAPLAIVMTLLLNIRTQRRHLHAPDQSDLILFFLSTYLGRCPPPVLKTISASVRVAAVTWMLGMFFLVQFTQTNITASRNVPSHSPQVRRVEELVSRLHDGSMMPCVHFLVARVIHEFGNSVPHIASIEQAMRKCGKTCLSANIQHDCIPRALNGAHVVVHRCRVFVQSNVMSSGLVVGDDRLLTYPYCMPTHARYPQR